MNNFDLSGKKRFTSHWISFAAASLLAAALAGCGGGGSSETAAVVPPVVPPVVVPPVVTPPAVAAPTGAAPITLTATTPAATFAALTPAVPAVAVSIASPPKVTFSLTDGAGNAIKGFGSKAQSATATVASYPNLAFSIAKMVPGVGTAPSRWVSYIVTTVPTKNATTGAITASVPTRPTTDSNGTLVDNGDGTYTYTFYRDIAKIKDEVAAAAETATNKNADLDDLTYDANAVHRLTIQISGNAPGTGTNTPTAVQTTTGVPMTNPLNVIYDFIPATGKAVTTSGRDISATAKCEECHKYLGGFPGDTDTQSDASFHGGSRNKIEYCVVCHTDQRKYGRAEATTTAAGYSGTTYRINGIAMGNNANNIHKIHMSEGLTKTGYNYGGVLYEEACKYPQDIRNCTKCHDGSATSSAKTAQGDNWKNVPQRMACGACHDGINFTTGKGLTLKDKEHGLTTSTYGHVGGSQSDDAACALCHKAADIEVYHLPVTRPNAASGLHVAGGSNNTNAGWIASNTDRLPAGAVKVTYDIQSVSLNASKQPVMVFRLLQNGTPFPLNDPTKATEIWPNYMGSPSIYYVFAVPQDGITAPADFNASVSGYLKTIWNGKATGTGAGTLTGPDASGYYTVTLTGVTIPTSAVMLTGGIGYSYNVSSALPLTQTNLPDYPTAASTVTGQTNKTGGLIVVSPNVQKVVTGYTARRVIVNDALCNKCHQELGPFTEEAFHAGQRNDGTTCSWCHNPNRASSGWSADSTAFVHAIHAAAKRTVPYNWHAISATNGFFKIGYPGILNSCETCHTADGYDFSSAAASAAQPNKQYRTVMTGNSAAATISTSPYVAQVAGTAYGSGFSYSAGTQAITAAAGTTLVSSPTVAVCTACHDSAVATQHMESNGGSFYKDRTSALAKAEQCMFCHSSSSAFGLGIKAVHTVKK